MLNTCRRSGHLFSTTKAVLPTPIVEWSPQFFWRTKKEHFVRSVSSLMKQHQILTPSLLATVAGFSAGAGNQTAGFDPVLISLIRRSMPNLVAYDLAGVQPMNGPTGLIFAMRSRYDGQNGAEALFDEADTNVANSGAGTTQGYVGR